MRISRTIRLAAGAVIAALLLASCGGGNDPSVTRLVVAGDSLADAGTYGLKFTVQNANAPAAGFPIYPEIVADAYELGDQCNYYVSTNSGFARNSEPNCSNYAIGGGRILNPAANGGADSPLSIPRQLQAAGADFVIYGEKDMILVDGGGNDAADLVGAYLGAASGDAGATAYRNFLLQQLTATEADGALAQPNGAAVAAGLYMQRLADTFYDAIDTHVLDRGASQVVVLNMPDITLTPRFQAVLAGVRAANGAQAAAQLQGAIQQWITAFNTQLATRIGDDDRVTVVDFYGTFTAQVANPADFGLDNATTPACPAVGVDGQGLPTYDFPTCTSAALDQNPPAGETAGWWRTWLFSDGFHPTPYGHALLADAILDAVDD
ncbi:MAG: SGNH/GDSL hydrolase family protein [Ramlibacter sp.]